MKASGRCNHSYRDGALSNFPGAEYTPDEIEFMMAMDRFKSRVGRMPTPAEVLEIARALGYRKTEVIRSAAAGVS